MTEFEYAYIAGVIDGKGSIMLLKFHKNQNPSPCISISSSTIELLYYIKSRVNAGTIRGKKNYNLDRHKDSFTYEARFNKALELLKEIAPYLVIEAKRKKAELIISKYKKVTPRNERYNIRKNEEKEMFYNEFMNIK